MKTLILAAIRCSLMFTAVAALSLAYPASVQAVPTTYQLHRQPLHRRDRPLHHERLRDGNGDVGGPPGSEHAAHTCHSYCFYFFRWGADINVTQRRPYHSVQIRNECNGEITSWAVSVDRTRSYDHRTFTTTVLHASDEGIHRISRRVSETATTLGCGAATSPRRTRGLPYH